MDACLLVQARQWAFVNLMGHDDGVYSSCQMDDALTELGELYGLSDFCDITTYTLPQSGHDDLRVLRPTAKDGWHTLFWQCDPLRAVQKPTGLSKQQKATQRNAAIPRLPASHLEKFALCGGDTGLESGTCRRPSRRDPYQLQRVSPDANRSGTGPSNLAIASCCSEDGLCLPGHSRHRAFQHRQKTASDSKADGG